MKKKVNQCLWNIIYKDLVKRKKKIKSLHINRTQGAGLRKARQGKISLDSQNFSSSASQRYKKKMLRPTLSGQIEARCHL